MTSVSTLSPQPPFPPPSPPLSSDNMPCNVNQNSTGDSTTANITRIQDPIPQTQNIHPISHPHIASINTNLLNPSSLEASSSTACGLNGQLSPTSPSQSNTPCETESPPSITQGYLKYRTGGLKFERFLPVKRFFWLGTYNPLPPQNLEAYLRSEKPDISFPNVAWSACSGSGLLYASKKESLKSTPDLILNLADISELHQVGSDEIIFKLNGQKLTLTAKNSRERSSWFTSLQSAHHDAVLNKPKVYACLIFRTTLSELENPTVNTDATVATSATAAITIPSSPADGVTFPASNTDPANNDPSPLTAVEASNTLAIPTNTGPRQDDPVAISVSATPSAGLEIPLTSTFSSTSSDAIEAVGNNHTNIIMKSKKSRSFSAGRRASVLQIFGKRSDDARRESNSAAFADLPNSFPDVNNPTSDSTNGDNTTMATSNPPDNTLQVPATCENDSREKPNKRSSFVLGMFERGVDRIRNPLSEKKDSTHNNTNNQVPNLNTTTSPVPITGIPEIDEHSRDAITSPNPPLTTNLPSSTNAKDSTKPISPSALKESFLHRFRHKSEKLPTPPVNPSDPLPTPAANSSDSDTVTPAQDPSGDANPPVSEDASPTTVEKHRKSFLKPIAGHFKRIGLQDRKSKPPPTAPQYGDANNPTSGNTGTTSLASIVDSGTQDVTSPGNLPSDSTNCSRDSNPRNGEPATPAKDGLKSPLSSPKNGLTGIGRRLSKMIKTTEDMINKSANSAKHEATKAVDTIHEGTEKVENAISDSSITKSEEPAVDSSKSISPKPNSKDLTGKVSEKASCLVKNPGNDAPVCLTVNGVQDADSIGKQLTEGLSNVGSESKDVLTNIKDTSAKLTHDPTTDIKKTTA